MGVTGMALGCGVINDTMQYRPTASGIPEPALMKGEAASSLPRTYESDRFKASIIGPPVESTMHHLAAST